MGKSNLSEKRITNRLVVIDYAVIGLILMGSYLLEVIKGSRTLGYYAIFLVFLFIPGIINAFIHLKNQENKYTKYILTIGYLIFYLFVLFTSTSILSFVYIFPLLMIFPLFHDWKYSTLYCILVVASNGVYAFYNLVIQGYVSDKGQVVNIEVQMACLLLVCTFSVITSVIDAKMVGIKMAQISEEKKNVENMLNKIKNLVEEAKKKTDEITGKTEALRGSADTSMDAMNQVCEGTSTTAETIQEQLSMIDEMSNSMDSITGTLDQFHLNVEETLKVIDSGIKNLQNLNNSSDKIKKSSEETNDSIQALISKIEKIDAIITTIGSISSRTNLLSLNASIEATRAGEAGKGFAVVADEIQKLNVQTSEALNQIKDEIAGIFQSMNQVKVNMNGLNNQVDGQNEIITQTETVFTSIESSSKNIEGNCGNIVVSMQNIQNAKNTIVDSVSTVSAVSEETTANASSTLDMNKQNLDTIELLGQDIKELEIMIQNLTK